MLLYSVVLLVGTIRSVLSTEVTSDIWNKYKVKSRKHTSSRILCKIGALLRGIPPACVYRSRMQWRSVSKNQCKSKKMRIQIHNRCNFPLRSKCVLLILCIWLFARSKIQMGQAWTRVQTALVQKLVSI